MTHNDTPITATRSEQDPAACVHCGAAVSSQARYCWLCGGKITPSAAQDALPSVRASRWRQPLTGTQALMFWLGTILVALVGYGVVRSQDRFFAAMYLLTAVPALVVTLIGATTARVAGRPWTPGKVARVGAMTAASSLATAAAVAAIIVVMVALLVVSMIAAFFALCSSLTGGH